MMLSVFYLLDKITLPLTDFMLEDDILSMIISNVLDSVVSKPFIPSDTAFYILTSYAGMVLHLNQFLLKAWLEFSNRCL